MYEMPVEGYIAAVVLCTHCGPMVQGNSIIAMASVYLWSCNLLINCRLTELKYTMYAELCPMYIYSSPLNFP